MSKLFKISTSLALNFLNKNLYNKSYLRGSKFNFSRNKNLIRIFDNNDNLEFLVKKKDRKYTCKETGHSVNSRDFLFTHRRHNLFRFTRTVSNFSINFSSVVTNFLRLLYCLNTFKQYNRKFRIYCLILKPQRCGYLTLSNGILGLLPTAQVSSFCVKPIFFNYDRNLRSFLLPFNTIQLTRFPIYDLVMVLVPQYIYNSTFSKKKTYRAAKGTKPRFVTIFILSQQYTSYLGLLAYYKPHKKLF